MTDVNIHLTVDDQTLAYCRTINQAIQQVTQSPIIFSDASPMRPHVTLVVGRVRAPEMLEDVVAAVSSEVEQTPPLTLRLLTPYLWPSEGSERFVFTDIEDAAATLDLRTRLLRRLDGHSMDVDHSSLVQPHITLAYVRAITEDVTQLLHSSAPTTPLHCRGVELSHVGPHGTCIDSIHSAAFPGDTR